MSNGSSDSGNGGVQSVDRALHALEILGREGEAGVTELAADIGVHKSTASRLLGSLEERELVEQVHDRGKYRLGFGILRLANAVSGRLDVSQQGREICESLAAQIGETVNIAVRRSHYAVNVDQARGPSAVGTQNWVGALTPLHATSSGKILLAFMTPEARRELLEAAGLTRFTERTLVSVDELEQALIPVPGDGYAVSIEELEIGLNAVAAPIRNHHGVVIAALSVSGPVYRLSERRTQEIVPAVVAAADAVAFRMGYQS
ncbi:IclR family transcriptional regulator [Mycobacteroides abscessus]|uniref:IclR family transcriptional regulator n=1 Tax=Mycobacteroides abscessus TaxID=36809 RepID=UPI0009A726D3|nr:IclR family transcriptional regulator [Mycobacteroides abscessus]SKF64741.1 transcriptional regulator [Mycobacteroides abscessus subsp. bolletii]SKF64869.1 transcriptional regulator [Mycobacteroides abscessus subsp. bolletii]SKF85796.1 transcriptional regulator [Mycobacteroides abscessus subsp. bolletii]SKG60774.1 transcriptional regulator [Mycobacteroides abscessus subsp. bolletii]SKG73355.1 transcriptional regulator [Mycobacteroides abscessus subsp. bolletii]